MFWLWNVDSLQRLLRHENVKGNLRHGGSGELEDKFDLLMDANDQILEQVVSLFICLSVYFVFFPNITCYKKWHAVLYLLTSKASQTFNLHPLNQVSKVGVRLVNA